jgi:hypothetical protein
VKVEEQYAEVLQNIEFGIVSVYRECPNLSDYDVMRALEAVIDGYAAENIGRPPRQFRLSEEEAQILATVRHMCEWRLGRRRLDDGAGQEKPGGPDAKTIDEILLCLRKVLKSVQRWNKDNGRQGYLNFIVQFVR